jgi:death-on-curing protein
MKSIDLAEYLAIAEGILGVPGEDLRRVTRIALAESALAAPFAAFGGVEFYEGLPTRAAILCSRLVRNHPLPDGNKRTAYVTMIMFIRINEGEWHPPEEDERVDTLEQLAAGSLLEEDFIVWVGLHTEV